MDQVYWERKAQLSFLQVISKYYSIFYIVSLIFRPNFTLAAHDIIRCGQGVSPGPFLDETLYSSHLGSCLKTEFPVPSKCAEYTDKVIDSVRS